jgi:mycothiol synthase
MATGKGTRGAFPPWESLGLSNLFLVNTDIANVVDRKTLPEEMILRTTDFNEQDMSDLAETLDMAFGIQHGEWNVLRVHKELIAETQVKKTFVIEYQGKVISTASVRVNPEKYPGQGYMHWVAVHPDHQGFGLASILSNAVLREFVSTYGFSSCVLETQDTSLPAISTYLKAGFRPKFLDSSHEERWQQICQNLNINFSEICQNSLV